MEKKDDTSENSTILHSDIHSQTFAKIASSNISEKQHTDTLANFQHYFNYTIYDYY